MFTSYYIPQVTLVVFLFSKDLHTCHEQIVIAEKLLENETAERIAKTFVSLWVKSDNFHWDVETLTCRSWETKKTVLEGIYSVDRSVSVVEAKFYWATYTQQRIDRRERLKLPSLRIKTQELNLNLTCVHEFFNLRHVCLQNFFKLLIVNSRDGFIPVSFFRVHFAISHGNHVVVCRRTFYD